MIAFYFVKYDCILFCEISHDNTCIIKTHDNTCDFTTHDIACHVKTQHVCLSDLLEISENTCISRLNTLKHSMFSRIFTEFWKFPFSPGGHC